MLLNPLLEALEAARKAASDAVHPDGRVTVDDRGDRWEFEFMPRGDVLGGGAKVSVSKDDTRVLKVVCAQ
jgi:hypothetical protein